MIYLFDVDGTLTPSRGRIVPEFENWFQEFAARNRVSLVTGSDYNKTVEQLGESVMELVEYSFNCSGNAIYHDNELVFQSDWVMPADLYEALYGILDSSEYPDRFGNHIEERIGCVNFSVVGRNAIGQQRTDYYEWDLVSNEREKIAKFINNNWKDVSAVIGGETGIDIFEKFKDKSQILSWLDDDVMFFGDRLDPAGNDYELAKQLDWTQKGISHHVRHWQDTHAILQSIWPPL